MPLPKPNPSEKEDAFISRCMADSFMGKEYPDNKQRSGVCYTQWREKEKSIEVNDELLKHIKARKSKLTSFGRGILTADAYVKTFAEMVGLQDCYQYAATRDVSFDDIIQKASRTLVYSNDEMDMEEKASSSFQFKAMLEGAPEGTKLPKNTLMVFRHKLSTSQEDRDKDILRTQGMELDPKMLLLWQHIHTMPLGPYLYTVSQDDKSVRVVSAIVDINETTHDAAVMMDNGMGRFSHGFKAIEFTKRRNEKGEVTGGFDIHKSEIMEESLVSVPANIGADTEEVLLNLIEGGKLTSPLMKSVGRYLREERPLQSRGIEIKYREKQGDLEKEVTCASLSDLKLIVDSGIVGSEIKGENKDEKLSGDKRSGEESIETETGSSKETDDVGNKTVATAEQGSSGDKEVNKTDEKAEDFNCECLKCGHKITSKTHCKDIKCPKCGGEMRREERPGPGRATEIYGEKAGRTISKANEKKIKDALDDIKEALQLQGLTRACKALLDQANNSLGSVISSLGEVEKSSYIDIDTKQAMAVFLEKSTEKDQEKMLDLLKAFVIVDKRKQSTRQFREICGG